VSTKLRIVASDADAALAGLEGEFSWGSVATADDEKADVTVALGEAMPANCASVRWLPGPLDGPSRGRMVATGGEGLWRRAPWPVRDRLFELPPSDSPEALVVDPDGDRRERVAALVEDRGLGVVPAPTLDLTDLTACGVVIFPSSAGEPLPALAFAVLAARRVLITGPSNPSFGLLPEIDWFAGGAEHELVDLADSVLSHPAAFALPRAMGAVAAERHRASSVYGRLVADLALEGALGSPDG
jgi:hypothetical protein